MPWLVAALLSGLVQIVGTLVGRVAVALGMGLVTYTGFSSTLGWLKSSAVSAIVALPPEVVGMLSVLKVGTCISIVFSSLLARMVVSGLQGDTVKKWVTK
jgi:hypothetical protein